MAKVGVMPQRGAMYEVNLLVWPALYGYTGWLWGAPTGWPLAVTIAAALSGVVAGILVMRINPYGIVGIVALLALALPWFLDAEIWRWTALALCAAPLPVVALGLILRKTWV